MSDYVEIKLRIPQPLAEAIDKRRKQAGVTQGRPISRNEWFINMAEWVVDQLPHQAVRADLIKAWDDMPPEALGIDK